MIKSPWDPGSSLSSFLLCVAQQSSRLSRVFEWACKLKLHPVSVTNDESPLNDAPPSSQLNILSPEVVQTRAKDNKPLPCTFSDFLFWVLVYFGLCVLTSIYFFLWYLVFLFPLF